MTDACRLPCLWVWGGVVGCWGLFYCWLCNKLLLGDNKDVLTLSHHLPLNHFTCCDCIPVFGTANLLMGPLRWLKVYKWTNVTFVHIAQRSEIYNFLYFLFTNLSRKNRLDQWTSEGGYEWKKTKDARREKCKRRKKYVREMKLTMSRKKIIGLQWPGFQLYNILLWHQHCYFLLDFWHTVPSFVCMCVCVCERYVCLCMWVCVYVCVCSCVWNHFSLTLIELMNLSQAVNETPCLWIFYGALNKKICYNM